MNSHTISDRRGVNLPGCEVDLPAVSEKDRADLQFGVEQGVDFIFASFIRTSEQVDDVRQTLGLKGKDIMIISKIENHQGVQNIDAIIDKSDGIMVARGDLGV
uniref:Pyruvate kinase n=1 Tax=Lygus hesperus TaxID=30085 RepID=A0A0A9ZFX2_LYGHE